MIGFWRIRERHRWHRRRGHGAAHAGASLLITSILTVLGPAHADPLPVAPIAVPESLPASAPVTQYSRYERESIDDALRDLHATVDPSPEGKEVEGIDVLPLEVIESRDPAPRFLNEFHATTRPRVLRREVLLTVGEPYRQYLADETSRNLRQLRQLSLVICLPLRGSRPDRVRVLVIAKDVWSLRLGYDVAFGPGGLESLLVEPTESNLAGTHHTVLARLTLAPLSYSLGASYYVPRLEGRRLSLITDANIVFNRQSGSPEGSFGTASISRPLYSILTEWGWGATVSWDDEVLRRYINARLAVFHPAGMPDGVGVPYAYRSREFTETLAATRSFGKVIKNDVSFGVEMNRQSFRTGDLSGFDPAAVANFVSTQLPVSDTRVGPFVQWRGYGSEFLRVLDFETLGLQEDYRLGHDLWVRLYPVTAALGSTRTFFGSYGAAQYTIPVYDGLLRGSVQSTVEAESDRVADASVSLNLRAVTPRFALGRLVVDAQLLNRYRNYLNRTSFLGGEGRLRGYPSNFFIGKDLLSYNVEFRSRPVEILSCQLGGVLFYDAGDAFSGFDHLELHHAVGFGLRALFPQLDRVAFRVDVGFPIAPGGLPAGVMPASFFVSFDQAFALTTVGDTAAQGVPSSGVGALGQ